MNPDKSSFEHTCEGGPGGRKRSLKTSTLTAAVSPLRNVLKSISSSETLSSSIASTGLKPPRVRTVQNFVRRQMSTSWEQHVVELHHLRQFLGQLRDLDPRGTYLCDAQADVYNGVDVSVFQRYFVSWGAAREIICETPLLCFLAVDAAHMKSAFGGVAMAAVVATANFKIFPAAWAIVDCENEGNCLWFHDRVLKCFPNIKFVWMTDQGTALNCGAIHDLMTREGQLHALCAKHLIKTIEVARTRKEIGGSLAGMRDLIYRFSRARTRERGELVLREISGKNRDVGNYLRDRRDEIFAIFFLEHGVRRGGRITSQLVESFFNMAIPFREKGPVEGIIWMCDKFQSVQVNERASFGLWTTNEYRGTRVQCLSREASAKFLEIVGGSFDKLRVENLLCSDLRLEGDVFKKDDGTARHIVITRPSVGGKMEIFCPCQTHQEVGLPCARAAQLLVDGRWCKHGLPAGAVADYLLSSTWKKQADVNVVVPAVPSWSLSFSKQNPSASLRDLVSDVGKLDLFPGRVPVPAGRPKLVKRARKALRSHFARIKSGTEKGDTRKRPKGGKDGRDVGVAEGDDEIIDAELDVDVPVVDLVEEGSESEGDDEEEDEGEGLEDGEDGEVVEEKVVRSLADLFYVGSGQTQKRAEQAKCSSCGGIGHKWPKCRKRDIELMLVNIGAMSPRPVVDVVRAPQPAVGVIGAVAAAVHVAVAPARPGPSQIPLEEPRGMAGTARRSKRERMLSCVRCHEETPDESWRLFGFKCCQCTVGFIHNGCVSTAVKEWTCEECE